MFFGGIGAELEILTRTPDLLVTAGTTGFQHQPGVGSTGFTPDGFIQSIPIAHTLIVEAIGRGTATWSGSGDAAKGSGIARAAGTLSLLNNSPDPLDVDVLIRIPGQKRLLGGGLEGNAYAQDGSVDNDASEVSQSVIAISLIGSRLPGIPEDLATDFLLSAELGTRDPLVGTNYDIIGLLFERRFTVTLPGAEGTTFEFFDLGLRVEAGGQALSLFDGASSEALVAEPFPFDLGSRSLPIPEPSTLACLLWGFMAVAVRRRRR